MKKGFYTLFALLFFLGILMFSGSLISANTLYEKNYTINNLDIGKSGTNFVVRELKYDPYPVNAGDYFDVYIKVQNIGSDDAKDAEFELQPNSPFSSTDNLVRDYGIIYGTASAHRFDNNYDASQVVLKYRVMVDKNSPEGVSNLKLKVTPDRSISFSKTYDIPITIRQPNANLEATQPLPQSDEKWIYAAVGFLFGVFVMIIILILVKKRRRP